MKRLWNENMEFTVYNNLKKENFGFCFALIAALEDPIVCYILHLKSEVFLSQLYIASFCSFSSCSSSTQTLALAIMT